MTFKINILLQSTLFIIAFTANAQIQLITGFRYKLISTELSPKEAIQQAKKEALNECIKENLGVQVMNLTKLEKKEAGKIYSDRFQEFTQQFSAGYVKNYTIKDTIQTYSEKTLTLETILTLDITLFHPGNDNPMGLTASCNKSFFSGGELAFLTYFVKKEAFIYIFDFNYRNEYLLLYRSVNAVPANISKVYPDEKMAFQLAMTKEEKSDFEFGSFVLIATDSLLDLGVQPADTPPGNPVSFPAEQFFSSTVRKNTLKSIVYLPYCIE